MNLINKYLRLFSISVVPRRFIDLYDFLWYHIKDLGSGSPPLYLFSGGALSVGYCAVLLGCAWKRCSGILRLHIPWVTCVTWVGSLSPHISSLHSSHSLINTFYPHACSVGSVFQELWARVPPSYYSVIILQCL